MKNYFNFAFLLITSLMCMAGTKVSAHDIEAPNDDGASIYYVWTNNQTELAVSCKGDYFNSYDDEYTGNLVIPESVTYQEKTYPVTTICDYAFYGCTKLTGITVPKSITNVATGAFHGMPNLTSVTFHCKEIDNWLANFESVKEVVIGDEVTTIGNSAFYSCTGLTNISIPNSVTSIGSYAFCGCSGLTSVVIPNSVTTIGSCAFYLCYGLTSITLPNSLTSIGEHSFAYCPIKSITIPHSLTNIGNWAFQGCSELSSVTFHCREIGPWFAGLSNVQEVVIGDEVTSIGERAFYNFNRMTSVTIPNSVTTIGERAFRECSSLKNVTIPNSVTSIGEYAFAECSGLESVTLSNSLESIGNNAFEFCNSLTSVDIPSSVVSIGERAFANCSSLTSLTIPNLVTSIGNEAFYCCNSVTSLTIPYTVAAIGINAFSGCKAIENVIVPVSDMADFCDNGFVGLISQRIKAPIMLIDREGKEITDFIIPADVTNINDYALSNCSGLKSVMIPNSVTAIGKRAFDGCSGLKSIIIPQSVTTIGDMAFAACPLDNVMIRGRHMTSSNSFSFQTYEHAAFFVPVGANKETIIEECSWYSFINVKEIALLPSELSTSDTYLVMNTQTFNYTVYDNVSDRIVEVELLNDTEEESLFNNWQVVRENGQDYLYNIGTHKYASISTDGVFVLSSTPTAIKMQESENGIVLGDNTEQSWGFVLNKKAQASPDLTGIERFDASGQESSEYYSIGGLRISKPQKGVNIVRMSNGKAQKVVKK